MSLALCGLFRQSPGNEKNWLLYTRKDYGSCQSYRRGIHTAKRHVVATTLNTIHYDLRTA